MCGIVGVLSAYQNGFNSAEADAFRDMLVIDSFRGLDSTGVFGVDNLANVRIVKAAQHGLDFVLQQAYEDFSKEMVRRGVFAVGHNRAATKGEINDKNAHPFYVDDKIVLVQNGTVRGDHKSLGKKTKDLEVDSEAVAHLINENEDIEKALQQLDSAYALVWFNVETETLHMIRNLERPLWLSKHKTRNGVVFASEAPTILYALSKYNLTDYEAPKMLEPGMLMSFKLHNNHFKEESKKIDHVFRSKVTTYSGTSYGGGYGGSRRRHPFWESEYGGMLGEAWDDSGEVVVPFRHKHAPMGLPAPSSSYKDAAKRDVKLQFGDYAASDLRDFHLLSNEVDAEVQKVLKATNKDNIFVELEDYIEANKEQDCRTWHLWGTVLCGEADEKTKVIAHCIMYDKTDSEMKQLMSEVYYTAERASIISHRFTSPSGVEKTILKTYISKLEPFVTTVNKELQDAASSSSATVH